jgi:hypothetical protein
MKLRHESDGSVEDSMLTALVVEGLMKYPGCPAELSGLLSPAGALLFGFCR